MDDRIYYDLYTTYMNLDEARRAKRARKGSKSYEEVKAEIDAKEKEAKRKKQMRANEKMLDSVRAAQRRSTKEKFPSSTGATAGSKKDVGKVQKRRESIKKGDKSTGLMGSRSVKTMKDLGAAPVPQWGPGKNKGKLPKPPKNPIVPKAMPALKRDGYQAPKPAWGNKMKQDQQSAFTLSPKYKKK